MEGTEKCVDTSVTSDGVPASPRWAPTKEQISMLESFYLQGIRTPNAEQIQQITSMLKVYGHIEGKNVFYWFQNHKARQRQKLKQENMAYFMTHYLHNNGDTTTPPLFPPCPNVVSSPYYMPQSDLGLYQQNPKVLLPGGLKRKSPKTKKVNKKTNNTCGSTGHLVYEHMNNNGTNSNQQTLALFPLEPTGILEASSSNVNTPSSSSETTNVFEEGCGHDQPFIDFFS